MEKLSKLNEIIEDYINYLIKYNPIFLNHANFFSALHHYDSRFKLSSVEYEKMKMNATDTFLLVREFFETYYIEELKEVEELFNSGVFDIYYIDEVEEENIYVTAAERTFTQQIRDGHYNLRLPLKGDINDFRIIVHEIRHQLNHPIQGRGPSNDTLTEALSMFDELLAFSMLENKIGKEIVDKIKNNYFAQFTTRFAYINFVCNLVLIKDKLGSISEENYEILFGSKGKEKFMNDCLKFEEKISSYKDIDADRDYWYTFGTFLIFTMYDEYKNNPLYLEKVKELNRCLKNNIYIVGALRVVNIDLTDDNIIDTLRNNLINAIKTFDQKVR